MPEGLHRLTVTVEEAAALLGVCRSTAYELVARGELPTIRMRRRILVPTAGLAKLLGISIWDVGRALYATAPAAPEVPVAAPGHRSAVP